MRSQTKINMKYADERHFRIEEEKELYKELLELYHTDYMKLDKDLEAINIKLVRVRSDIQKNEEEIN